MRNTTDACRYRGTVPAVMVALFLFVGVASAGCGGGDVSSALPTPGLNAEGDGPIDETSTSRRAPRSSTTKSPSRTATTKKDAGNGSSSETKEGSPSKKGGTGAPPGTSPGGGSPSVTNAGPNTDGPGPNTGPKVTNGPSKPARTTTTSSGRTYPGPSDDPGRGAVVTPTPRGGPPIIPPEELVARYDRIYEALPARSQEVLQQTEGVVRLTSDAPPESQPAVTGDAAVLVAAAEEVNRTGNVAKYEEPQVRSAYQNMKAQQAQVPAGVAAGR